MTAEDRIAVPRRPRSRRLLLAGGVVLAALVVVGGGVAWFVFRLGTTREQFAPSEFTDDAVAQFRLEFPDAYYFLLQLEAYRARRFRVVHGLGGRWGRLSLTRAPTATLDREQLRTQLANAFRANGWTRPAQPLAFETARDLFGIQNDEWADDDFEYTHGALPGERDNVFHQCRVYIAPDGGKIVAYCEMGW